ncbi:MULTISPECIES: hypothetical protein [unclassified Mesorhizobium]|uniref:hypothetical protein n=1 Tax=unclassified Mesorhizobium TaxID=325217 RepID=UPI001CD01594|nr:MULTISPECIES: hypothetical protein [unclassified Mesorhizobium]MBZ9739817.1 hypothetical protein [Mesorhizobium sp. CO1-1-4]MBZ9805628.1 hypothetical protein [Mesorhizobium sp. ES1-6]
MPINPIAADHSTDIPKVGLAIITGSANWGLAFPEDAEVDGVRTLQRDMSFETPFGRTDNWKLIEFDASITAEGKTKQALCMYSHGNPRHHIDHSCHRRAFWVLMSAGVRQILACSTIGAVTRRSSPATWWCPPISSN